MAQTEALIDTLKRALRARGVKYREVAAALDLSEASVKRLFATGDFSLERLEQVCELIGIQISDLVRMMEAEHRQLTELTEAQEEELVSDPKFLMTAYLVISGFNFDQLMALYRYDESELVRYLARLDKIKIIELLPNNRIKLLISPQFAWRKDGPIQHFFMHHLQTDYLRHTFDDDNETLYLQAGFLTRESNALLIRKLKDLAAEFNDIKQTEMHLPLERRDNCCMVLAVRNWRPQVFDDYRR